MTGGPDRGAGSCAGADDVGRRAVEAWAASGAMALTGRGDGPGSGPPARLVGHVRASAARLARASAAVGNRVEVDGLDLLVQRAAIAGLTRQGTLSCGGAARLLPTGDGWLAVALPRPTDVELVGAWLELDDPTPDADPWPVIAAHLRHRPGRILAERAAWLGLAVSELGERHVDDDRELGGRQTGAGPVDGSDEADDGAEQPVGLDHPVDGVRSTPLAGAASPGRSTGCRVLDLSSLWAGPLCGQLLRRAGADVVKVESTRRPDGARSGPARFFDLLHVGQRSVALDFTDRADVVLLHRLVEAADIVIEASRPRALAQLGLDPMTLPATDGPQVWVSITGYGRSGDDAGRVGFGDDAAAAGGLVVFEGDQPRFCADAVADPLAGLAAAGAALDALGRGGRWLVDVPLASVAAVGAGPTLVAPPDVVAAEPPMPAPTGSGPRSGEHTRSVLADLDVASGVESGVDP